MFSLPLLYIFKNPLNFVKCQVSQRLAQEKRVNCLTEYYIDNFILNSVHTTYGIERGLSSKKCSKKWRISQIEKSPMIENLLLQHLYKMRWKLPKSNSVLSFWIQISNNMFMLCVPNGSAKLIITYSWNTIWNLLLRRCATFCYYTLEIWYLIVVIWLIFSSYGKQVIKVLGILAYKEIVITITRVHGFSMISWIRTQNIANTLYGFSHPLISKKLPSYNILIWNRFTAAAKQCWSLIILHSGP